MPVSFFSIAKVSPILLFALLVLACSEKSDVPEGKTEVKFLTMQLRPTFDDFFLELIKEYEAANPDIHITWLDFPYDNYNMKLFTSFMSDNAPDVINFSSEDALKFIDAGYVEPLNEYLTEEELGTYVPSILADAGTFEGNVYILPWYASSVTMFVNMAILEEAGLTKEDVPVYHEDLPGFVRTIKETTGKWGAYPLYTEHATVKFHLIEGGVPLFDDERTEAVFNTPRGQEVFDFWIDLYRKGLVPRSALTGTHRDPLQLFKAGDLAMLQTGPQLIGQVENDAPSVYENLAVFPQATWRETGPVHLIALHTIGVSSLSRNKPEAAKFAHFVTNSQNQLRFAKLVTILPSTTEALEDDYFINGDGSLTDQARIYSAQQIKIGRVFRPEAPARKFYSVLESVTERAALGNMETDEALAFAEEQWNEILQQR